MSNYSSSESLARRALKRIARIVLVGGYQFNRIYRLEHPPDGLQMPSGMICLSLEIPPEGIDSRLLQRFSYGGEDAYGYGLSLDGQLAAICWFWGHRRSHNRVPWHLSAREAIIVDLLTLPECRGRGLATLLIRHSSMEMRRLGMQTLYTWVWHSHRASYLAFEKAGWQQIAWVLEFGGSGTRRPLRFTWPALPPPLGRAAPGRVGKAIGRRQRKRD
jgi:GNAT superfamily N-acetyltransferase